MAPVDRRRNPLAASASATPVRGRPELGLVALGAGWHSDTMSTSPGDDRHAVHDAELVFAHVRAVVGDRATRQASPRLSARLTARALGRAGFHHVTGERLTAGDLRRDRTQFFDRSETVLVEVLALPRWFYGLYVEPNTPTCTQWAEVTAVLDELGRRVDARLAPADDFAH